METKWASLVSYGLTAQALKDFLPVDATLNATRAVKKLEITVPAAVTPNYMERLGTDGRFREASSQRHGMLTPRWKGQSSEIPTSPGSLTGAEAGYRPETPRPLPPPEAHRLPPRTPVLTTADA
jgi:hypothetical protein